MRMGWYQKYGCIDEGSLQRKMDTFFFAIATLLEGKERAKEGESNEFCMRGEMLKVIAS